MASVMEPVSRTRENRETGWVNRLFNSEGSTPEFQELKFTLHRKLLDRINLEALSSMSGERVRAEVRTAVARLVDEEKTPLSLVEKDRVIEEILDEVFGLGPLEPLLQDPAISDILVTTPHLVYVERGGKLYRTPVDISGADIAKFLEDLFSRRLQRHRIELQPTKPFLRFKIHGYPSSFYPVFVNLVDNAIFWLKDHPEPRIIRLDGHGDAMIVADNGPGVPARDRAAIFELGFTRKPGGRGLGLHISREVLDKVGYNLQLDSPGPDHGAAFRIEPKPKAAPGRAR